MNDRQPGGLLFVLLALIGASFFVQSSPNAEKTRAPAASQVVAVPGADGPPNAELVQLPLRHFLGLEVADELSTVTLAEHNVRLGALIACVPDPLDASIGFRFDLFLGTLKKALSTERFVLDNDYLPWKGYVARPSSFGSSAPRCYTEVPGVLLFRRSDNVGEHPTDLLLVYLVGDTAVAGIHKAAFETSVEAARQLLGEDGDALTIPVLGPVFSGSAESLARACRRAHEADGHPRFSVLSGSATSIDLAWFKGRAGTPFLATTLPAGLVKEALLEYVCEGYTWMRPETLRVAWLTESSTGYGIKAVSRRVRDSGAGAEATTSRCRLDVVDFPFPLHISYVRSAHGSDGVEHQPSLLQKRYVRLPLDEQMESRDTLPRLTPNMTAATVDLLIARTLTTIQREGFRYVGITATDPRDRIFLASLLRDHCPNAQILIVGSDSLYVHPEARRHLKGTIIGSTYPLFYRNQSWTFPWRTQWMSSETIHRHIVFPSQVEQGVYNAAVLLLNPTFIDTAGLEWEGPDWPWPKSESSPALVAYGSPFDEEKAPKVRPPVWISVVGNQDLWPLTYRSDLDPEKYTARLRRELLSASSALATSSPLRPSRETWPPLLALSLFALSFAFLYFRKIDADVGRYLFRENSRNNAPEPRTDAERRRAVKQARRDRRRRALYQFALFAPLAVVLGLLATLLCVPAFYRTASAPGLTVRLLHPLTVTGAVMAAAGGMCTLAFARLKRIRGEGRWSTPRNILTTLCSFGAAIAICFSDEFAGTILQVGVVLAGGWALAASIDAVLRGGFGPRAATKERKGRFVFTVCLAYVLAVVVPFAALAHQVDLGPAVLLYERTMHVFSGVSAFAPSAFLVLAFCSWGYCRLKRFYHRTEYFVGRPWPQQGECSSSGWSSKLVERIDRTGATIERFLAKPCLVLRDRIPGSFGLSYGVTLTLLLYVLFGEALPTYERTWFSVLLWCGLALFVVVWLHWFLEMAFLASRVLRLLRRAYDLPLSGAYGRLPEAIRSMIGRFSSARPFRRSLLSVPARYLEGLRDNLPPRPDPPQQDDCGLDWSRLRRDELPEIEDDLKNMLGAAERDTLTATRDPVERKLKNGARTVWKWLLPVWDGRAVSESFPETRDAESGPGGKAPAKSPSRGRSGAESGKPKTAGEWITLAEDYLAIQVIFYVSQYFRHLWNLLSCLMVASLLFLVAVISYPLQPQTTLVTWAAGMVVATGVAGLVVFVRMEQDKLISRVTNKANRIQFDRQFFQTVLTWLFPVAAVIAMRAFPELGSWFGSLLDPLSGAGGSSAAP